MKPVQSVAVCNTTIVSGKFYFVQLQETSTLTPQYGAFTAKFDSWDGVSDRLAFVTTDAEPPFTYVVRADDITFIKEVIETSEEDKKAWEAPVHQVTPGQPLPFTSDEDRAIRATREIQETMDYNMDVMSHNVGGSDYAKHKIQPWDIWEEYNLNPWDADIIKRTLRTKSTDTRILDYEKIIHICQKRISMITGK